jgi:DNA-binding NtrC family response regulator
MGPRARRAPKTNCSYASPNHNDYGVGPIVVYRLTNGSRSADGQAAASAGRTQVVLVVDDERDILDSLKELFEGSLKGVRVLTALSGPLALDLLRKEAVDLIVSDYRMPQMNGLDFLKRTREIAPGIPRILITAFPDLDLAIRAINEANIENFFTKPFDPAKVVEIVRTVLTERRAKELRDQSFARSLDELRRKTAKG